MCAVDGEWCYTPDQGCHSPMLGCLGGTPGPVVHTDTVALIGLVVHHYLTRDLKQWLIKSDCFKDNIDY